MDFSVKKEWSAWNYTSESGAKNQVAGYSVGYDINQGNEGAGMFEFITIRGARHEVKGQHTYMVTEKRFSEILWA